jgi:hypothetical protein
MNDYRFSPRKRRALVIAIIIGFAILVALALTDRADAATNTATEPARICRAYAWTCSSYRSAFGVRYCTAWQFRCTGYYADAGKIAGLAAPVTGNGGGCAEGNKWTRLDCIITYYTPGFVSGECDGGLWFRRERTSRTWVLDQLARATACEVQNDQLTGVPGWKFKLSR